MSGHSINTDNQIDVETMNEISGFSMETIKEKLKKDSDSLNLYGKTARTIEDSHSQFFFQGKSLETKEQRPLRSSSRTTKVLSTLTSEAVMQGLDQKE